MSARQEQYQEDERCSASATDRHFTPKTYFFELSAMDEN
jgi:hypothetical protein